MVVSMTPKELREIVHQSSVVIAHYWPMSSFVHHNPIRELETLPFEEAVRVARRFVGGRGYLRNEAYRELVDSGRISAQHVTAAVRLVAREEEVDFGGHKISHLAVLRAHLLRGFTAPADETIKAVVSGEPDSAGIRALAGKVAPGRVPPDAAEKIGQDLTLARWCDQECRTQLSWLIDRELIKWSEAFLDEGHSVWAMPKRREGFYAAWRSLAAKEWSPVGIANSSAKIAALPASPEEALLHHLRGLGIPEDLTEAYLSLELAALSGWASFINWRAERDGYEWQVAHPIDLVQYLAVRLFYERELVDQTCRTELGIEGKLNAIVSYVRKRNAPAVPDPEETARLAAGWRLAKLADALGMSSQELAAAGSDKLQTLLNWLDEFAEPEHGPVWLKAFEAGYHEDLISKLRAAVPKSLVDYSKAERPLAQVIFCIDVRSEPFRRSLEASGDFETIGFAGFFGIPMRSRSLDHHHETDQLPAIVQPQYRVREVAREDQAKQLDEHKAGVRFLHSLHEILHDLKSHVLTPFVTVESLGWIFGVPLIGRTIFPRAYRQWRQRVKNRIAPPVGTRMTADPAGEGIGLPPADQAAVIEGALRTMGLVRNFGRLVVLCGHSSTSDNNPYEAALNCGACGGNSGEPNARLFAALANKPQVRAQLAKNGVVIPEDTHFVGGVHDTTTDIVYLYDLEDLPETHRRDFEQLQEGFRKARQGTNRERLQRLPGSGSDMSPGAVAKEIDRRAGDWSETRPEWGLSGNAAFIIGNRALTKELNLQGRTFLNSHDYRIDPSGALLEGILNGPMVVGQWINAEHYFSATDPEIFGSGSKIYHNVVGRIGIMSGPQSDLRTGLAWQSVMSGTAAYHEPIRITVAIEAPRQRILEIVRRQPGLSQLCDNEWIHLVAIDRDSDDIMYHYEPNRDWVAIPDNTLIGAALHR